MHKKKKKHRKFVNYNFYGSLIVLLIFVGFAAVGYFTDNQYIWDIGHSVALPMAGIFLASWFAHSTAVKFFILNKNG